MRLVTLVLLMACTKEPGGDGPKGGGPGGSDTEEETPDLPELPAPVALTADRPAFDPIAGGVVAVDLRGAALEVVAISVTGEAGEVLSASITLDEAGGGAWSWDGSDGEGERVDAGSYSITATGEGEPAVVAVQIVHTGFVAVWAEDDDGVTSTRVPLFWAGDAWLQDDATAIAELESLDEDGAVVPFPPPTERLVVAAAINGTQPTAWAAGGLPLLTLQLAEDTSLGSSGLGVVPVEVEVDGWTVLSGSPLADGVPVVLQREAPLDATLGVTDEAMVLRLVAVGEDRHDLSAQELSLRFYRLVGPATFGRAGPAYHAWAGAVDEALRGVEGTPADPISAASALVAWIYDDLGLVYDTRSGASFYSSYGTFGSDWANPIFYMAEFLQRRNGHIINCSDATNITLAYANMLGVELHHIVIRSNFDLNFIHAIGTPDFTRCPFGSPFGCGFSYHAVSTPDAGGRIWDATLNLDGDGQPRELPSVDLYVQDIPGDQYLRRLVRSGSPTYQFESRITLQ